MISKYPCVSTLVNDQGQAPVQGLVSRHHSHVTTIASNIISKRIWARDQIISLLLDFNSPPCCRVSLSGLGCIFCIDSLYDSLYDSCDSWSVSLSGLGRIFWQAGIVTNQSSHICLMTPTLPRHHRLDTNCKPIFSPYRRKDGILSVLMCYKPF